MRAILGCAAILGLAVAATTASAAGQAKIDPKLLVGKWEPAPEKDKKEKEKPPAIVIEFTTDGKLTMTVTEAGKPFKIEGTYKLDADKIAVQLKFGEKELKETLTIKKLTSSELITEDAKGKAETLRKK